MRAFVAPPLRWRCDELPPTFFCARAGHLGHFASFGSQTHSIHMNAIHNRFSLC